MYIMISHKFGWLYHVIFLCQSITKLILHGPLKLGTLCSLTSVAYTIQ
jgi:hypothetical protein